MHRRRALASLGLSLVLGAGVVGCGNDDGDGDGTGAAAGTVETTTTTTTAAQGGPGASTTSSEAATTTTVAGPRVREVELSYVGGEVTGGSSRVAVAAGEAVRLVVTSDVAEEVHVHGYDLEVALAPGQPTPIDLVGDLPGVWEVELHGTGDVLCELEVAA